MTERVAREMAALVCYLVNLNQKNLKNFSFLQTYVTKDCYSPGAQGTHPSTIPVADLGFS